LPDQYSWIKDILFSNTPNDYLFSIKVNNFYSFSKTVNGYKGLNGDIIIWNPFLDRAFEISSMWIRVDKDALNEQLKIEGVENRKNLIFHKMLLNGEIPLSIGGGIGQSRICMYFLQKAHICEVQSSIWTDEMIKKCEENNIFLM
jgi:aspartate--ammonia ligase